jgi:hypothetical protein
MHAVDVLFLLWKVLRGLVGLTSFFCEDAAENGIPAPVLSDDNSPITVARMQSTLELLVTVLSYLGTLVLFIYYRQYNRRKQYSWTTDQVNACLIPLAVGATFIVIYYVSR